jgi:hypothetical protein
MTLSDYPYPDNPGQTHHAECWRTRNHHNCCVREVERLQRLLRGAVRLLNTEDLSTKNRYMEAWK